VRNGFRVKVAKARQTFHKREQEATSGEERETKSAAEVIFPFHFGPFRCDEIGG
jgi:hypothetical protein